MMRTILLGAMVLLVTACGEDTNSKPLDLGGKEGTEVATVIEELNDALGSPKKLDALFVKGARPADTKKLNSSSYSISGKPTVNGNSATCKVRVDAAASGQTLGEVEWTFEKEGDKWKIKTATLP